MNAFEVKDLMIAVLPRGAQPKGGPIGAVIEEDCSCTSNRTEPEPDCQCTSNERTREPDCQCTSNERTREPDCTCTSERTREPDCSCTSDRTEGESNAEYGPDAVGQLDALRAQLARELDA